MGMIICYSALYNQHSQFLITIINKLKPTGNVLEHFDFDNVQYWSIMLIIESRWSGPELTLFISHKTATGGNTGLESWNLPLFATSYAHIEYTGHLVCPTKTTSKENEKSALMCIPERKKDQIVLEYNINITKSSFHTRKAAAVRELYNAILVHIYGLSLWSDK